MELSLFICAGCFFNLVYHWTLRERSVAIHLRKSIPRFKATLNLRFLIDLRSARNGRTKWNEMKSTAASLDGLVEMAKNQINQLNSKPLSMSIEDANHLSRKGEYMTASLVICFRYGGELYTIWNVKIRWKNSVLSKYWALNVKSDNKKTTRNKKPTEKNEMKPQERKIGRIKINRKNCAEQFVLRFNDAMRNVN